MEKPAPQAVFDLHYFPSIEYFAALSRYERVLLESSGSYIKQTYKNRCYINSASGPAMLSVPVKKSEDAAGYYAEVETEAGIKWKNNHWRAIRSAYGRSPFFEHYSDAFMQTLYGGDSNLMGLNRKILTLCLAFLGLKPELTGTAVYQKQYPVGCDDYRAAFLPKNRQSAPAFPPYCQVFGNVFENNLSILDLLFCEGPAARSYLQKLEPAVQAR